MIPSAPRIAAFQTVSVFAGPEFVPSVFGVRHGVANGFPSSFGTASAAGSLDLERRSVLGADDVEVAPRHAARRLFTVDGIPAPIVERDAVALWRQ